MRLRCCLHRSHTNKGRFNGVTTYSSKRPTPSWSSLNSIADGWPWGRLLRWRRRRSRQTPGPGRVCDIRTAERYQICQTFHDKAIAPITVHLHIHDECAFVERAEMPEHSIIGQSLELLRRGHYHPSRLVETTGWYQWIGSGPGRDQHFTGIELTKSRTPSRAARSYQRNALITLWCQSP
jgi:hypothetical protein